MLHCVGMAQQHSPCVVLTLLALLCLATALAPRLTDCGWFDLWARLISILSIWLILPLGAVLGGLFEAAGLGETKLVSWRDLVHWWIMIGIPIAMASILTDLYLQDLAQSPKSVTGPLVKWVIASWIGQLLFATICIVNPVKSEPSGEPSAVASLITSTSNAAASVTAAVPAVRPQLVYTSTNA